MGKRPKVNIDTAAQAAAQQAQVGAMQAQTKAIEDQTAAANKAAEAKRVIDEQAAAASKAAALQQQNITTNMATDLTNQNKGTVVAGGSADVVDSAVASVTQKKRRSTGSLSSQLGVNI